MATRHSEYTRMPRDCYITPRWVYDALYKVEPWAKSALDVAPSDFKDTYNFLDDWEWPEGAGIATNPPFKLSEQFARHALDLPVKVNLALLLPHAWDAAKGRRGLFSDRRFKAKYTLTERIRWENLEQKANGPSSNHAWFVWRAEPRGFIKPAMGWLP